MKLPISGTENFMSLMALRTALCFMESYARTKSHWHMHSGSNNSVHISMEARNIVVFQRNGSTSGNQTCMNPAPYVLLARYGSVLRSESEPWGSTLHS